MARPWLRLKIRYYGSDWLFVESFFVVVDGERFDKAYAEFERDHGGGDVWEWYDESPTAKDLEMIKKIISSKKATIRFVGRQYHRDHVIDTNEKRALQSVLDAYEALAEGSSSRETYSKRTSASS